MAPWLRALAHHPVWTLPPPSSSSNPLDPTNHHRAPHLARTPDSRALGRSAPLSHSASSRSLFGLAASTGASSPSPSSASPSSKHPLKRTRSSVKHPSGASEKRIKGGRTTRVVVVRGTDLVVAVGSELRLASLADVKSRCSEDDDDIPADDIDLGDYKVLNTPAITFEIQQLVVNPTSKLLAVVGAHSVVVVVLPRRGWTNSVGKTLECRCLPVGAFYHSLPGSPSFASALWHPLGRDASSLLILTSDSTLREYTVSSSLDEPSQTLSFSRASTSAGPGAAAAATPTRGFGLSGVDRDAQTAVALCVGEGKGDWGPLTLYALMRNGDIVSLCPFLPKKAELSPAYVHALSAFVSTKVDYLSSSADPFASSSTPAASALDKRYSLQQQYVNSLVRQITTLPPSSSASSSSSLGPRALLASVGAGEPLVAGGDDGADEAHDPSAPRSVVAPSRPALAPRLQGPFLLQPAPAELDNGADGAACDLAYLSYVPSSPSSSSAGGDGQGEGEGEGVGVLAVAYRDGKVDLCLEVEKVEARFVGEATTPTPARTGAVVLHRSKRKGRGFGLDSESDDDEAQDDDAAERDEDSAADLPALAVYESLDLGLASAVSPAGDERVVSRALAHNAPTIVRDPLYADTLYVRHALGAHALFMGGWLRPVADALRGADGAEDDALEKDLGAVLKEARGTEVCWVLETAGAPPGADDDDEEEGAAPPPPVEGLALVNDVYLGYSLLLVTAKLQPVGVELALRIDPAAATFQDDPAAAAAPGTPAKPAPAAAAPAEPAYVSLLSTPFTVPALLAPRAPGQLPALPRLPSTKTELRITPDTLRQLGKHVSATQTAVRDLVGAAGNVSARVELQMRELARQVGKLRELEDRRAELGRSVGAAGAGAGGLEARVRAAEDTQQALLARTDRVLQRLVEAHQPQVSAVERKWFDELERLREQVEGGEDEDERQGAGGDSLAGRAQRLEAQMELLRPALEELRRKEDARRGGAWGGTPARAGSGGMGRAQLGKVEGLLSDEAKLLADAKRKVERLTSTLAQASFAA